MDEFGEGDVSAPAARRPSGRAVMRDAGAQSGL